MQTLKNPDGLMTLKAPLFRRILHFCLQSQWGKVLWQDVATTVLFKQRVQQIGVHEIHVYIGEDGGIP